MPDKEMRQKCWDARDAYWRCLDDGSGKERKDREDKCKQLKEALNTLCPAVWVSPLTGRLRARRIQLHKLSSGCRVPAQADRTTR